MKILGIETSAVTASCALCEIGEASRVIASGSLHTDQVHSKTLIPFMEAMLKGREFRFRRWTRLRFRSVPVRLRVFGSGFRR